MKQQLKTFWRNWIAKDWAVQRKLLASLEHHNRTFYLSNKYAPSVHWSVQPEEAYCTWRWHAKVIANQLTQQQGEIYTFKILNLHYDKKRSFRNNC